MSPDELIAYLEVSVTDRRPRLWEVIDDVDPAVVAEALAIASAPFTRQLLADVLGRQTAPVGVPALIVTLEDADPNVRSSAADALGKIFLTYPDDPQRLAAGAAIFRQHRKETERAPFSTLTSALGATRHEPARERLREIEKSDDDALRGAARWALAQFDDADQFGESEQTEG